MKRCVLVLIIILIFSSSVFAEAEEESLLQRQFNKLVDTEDIDIFLKEMAIENEYKLGESTKDLVMKIIRGEQPIDGESLKEGLGRIFFSELKFSLGLLSKILIITLISTILTNLQNSFEDSSISQLANYFTYILIASLIIINFSELMDMAKLSVGRMVDFMQVLLPILLTLLIVAGGPTTKLMFHPMILGTVNILGIMVNTVIFPLIYFSFLVSLLPTFLKGQSWGSWQSWVERLSPLLSLPPLQYLLEY